MLKRYRVISGGEISAMADFVLTRLGVPAASRGGQYLRRAVFLAVNEPGRRRTVTKLSEEISSADGAKPQKIANSMRCAYEMAYARTGFVQLSAMCQKAQKPQLSEFIAITAEIVRFTLETAVTVPERE